MKLLLTDHNGNWYEYWRVDDELLQGSHRPDVMQGNDTIH